MNVIKNEKGTFIELPRESITFCGNTEEEKKVNELIFDLSLENDRQQQELERYKNIIKLLKHFGENSLGIIYDLKDNIEPTENEWLNLIEYEKYLRELKGE